MSRTGFIGCPRRSATGASSPDARSRWRRAPRLRRRCLPRHRGTRSCPRAPGDCRAGAPSRAHVEVRPGSRGPNPVVVRHGRRDIGAVPRDALLAVCRVEGSAAARRRETPLEGAQESHDLHVTNRTAAAAPGNRPVTTRRRSDALVLSGRGGRAAPAAPRGARLPVRGLERPAVARRRQPPFQRLQESTDLHVTNGTRHAGTRQCARRARMATRRAIPRATSPLPRPAAPPT
jgi:hypothetical protein